MLSTVAHTYNLSTQEAEAGTDESSRPAWAMQSDPVSKDKQKKKGTEKALTAKPKFDPLDLDGGKEPTLMS